MEDFYTLPGTPSDLLTSNEVGERRLKTDINPKTIIQGQTLDRIAVQALQYRDEAVVRGTVYYTYWENLSVGVGAKVYAKFTTPPDRYVGILFREVTTNKERVFYRVYTGFSNATTGVSISIGNLRSGTANVSTSQFKVVTTVPVLTSASVVTIVPIFGEVNSGNRASGSLSNNNVFRLIPPSTDFLIEIDNQSAEAAYVLTELNFLELPLIVVPPPLVYP